MNIAMIQASSSRPRLRSESPVHTGCTPESSTAQTVDWDLVTRRLRRFGMALTGHTQEAEDLAQQAIAQVLTRAPHLADHAGFGRMVITRLWLDQQRSMRRRWKRALASATAAVASLAPRPAPVEINEQTQLLRRAIEALPARQRAAVTLRLIEGLEYPAIAQAMQCDVGTVRATLHLARTKLRNALERTDHAGTPTP